MTKRFEDIEALVTEEVLSREQLVDKIFALHPDYSPSSCLWVIGKLVERGKLCPIGYGYYQKNPEPRPCSVKEEGNRRLLERLQETFPASQLTAYETAFLEELGAGEPLKNALVVTVNKKYLFEVYLRLKERTERDVMIQPTAREILYYLRSNAIILQPSFSRAPSRKGFDIAPERLAVDLYKDKTINCLFPELEPQILIEKFLSMKNMNFRTILQYAERRKCKEEILAVLGEYMPLEVYAAAKGDNDDQDW